MVRTDGSDLKKEGGISSDIPPVSFHALLLYKTVTQALLERRAPN